MQWDGQHTPFGEMASVTGARVVELAFPGQRRDPETGLAYNWNRYYGPALGRYLQPDPIGLDGGWNRYLYARANPIAFTDFAGLFTDADHHGSRTFEGPTATGEAEDANFELFRLIAPAAKGLSAARSATAAAGGASKAADDAFAHGFQYSPRVRNRALQDPTSHNFPYSFDDVILATNAIPRANGYNVFRKPGVMNGREGVFEIGVTRDGVIDHRFFRPNR